MEPVARDGRDGQRGCGSEMTQQDMAMGVLTLEQALREVERDVRADFDSEPVIIDANGVEYTVGDLLSEMDDEGRETHVAFGDHTIAPMRADGYRESMPLFRWRVATPDELR